VDPVQNCDRFEFFDGGIADDVSLLGCDFKISSFSVMFLAVA
jgi:hypothetical protein